MTEAKVQCNVCHGTDFTTLKTGRIRCTNCKSNERHRLFFMYLMQLVDLGNIPRVLHFAPENRYIFEFLATALGDRYEPRDFSLDRFATFNAGGVVVKKFDLCADAKDLPSDTYDVIIHNHVLEHVPCDHRAVLWHLQRALTPSGLHFFSVPILSGEYDEDFGLIGAAERTRRFGQHDHVRRFGTEDLHRSLDILSDLETQLSVTPRHRFSEEQLAIANIPKSRWSKFSGATPFVLRKDGLDPTYSPSSAAFADLSDRRMTELEETLRGLRRERRDLVADRDRLEREYDAIANSRTWRLTKPARAAADTIKRFRRPRP